MFRAGAEGTGACAMGGTIAGGIDAEGGSGGGVLRGDIEGRGETETDPEMAVDAAAGAGSGSTAGEDGAGSTS
jgi:hypothetical protein